MKLYRILTGLALLGLMACERDANIKLPKVAPQLVITSFIAPQNQYVTVRVSVSRPVFGTRLVGQTSQVTDATVSLSDGNTVLTVPYSSKQQLYAVEARQFVKAGKTYTLTVTTPDGKKATATCTVPAETVAFTEVTLDSSSAGSGYYNYQANVKWQDVAGKTNYYTILYNGLQRGYTNPGDTMVIASPFINETPYLDDHQRDGQTISQRIDIYFNPGYDDFIGTAVMLLNTDIHYKKYHETLRTQYQNDGNPFAEPTLLYSNVSGGLGTFAAYNLHTVMLTP